MANTKDKDPILLEDDQEGGKGGKGKGGRSGSGVIPSFNEMMIAVAPDEAEIARCAKDALFAQRVSLKAQGEKVAALDKKQELRNRLSSPSIANEASGGGGTNLEEHPLLANLGGAFDNIEFPEIEAEAAAANNPELKNELKLGFGLSLDAVKYNLDKKNKEKMRMSARPAPEARQEYVVRPSAPRPRPPGFS